MISLALVALATASFDCTKATSSVEFAICTNPSLAARDRALQLIYRHRHKSPSLIQEQREWIREREKCHDEGCIQNAYDDRILLLGLSESLLGRIFISYPNDGSLNVVELGGGWQLFAILALWGKKMPGGPNFGDATGVVQIVNGRGRWINAEGCVLSFQRTEAAWSVRENNKCQWGKNVTMDGIYRLTRGRRRSDSR